MKNRRSSENPTNNPHAPQLSLRKLTSSHPTTPEGDRSLSGNLMEVGERVEFEVEVMLDRFARHIPPDEALGHHGDGVPLVSVFTAEDGCRP